MRILFTCVVGAGHFNPMVPLAKAFQAAGDSVAFATDPTFSAHVRGVGFEAFPAGLDMPEARRRFAEAEPDAATGPPLLQWRRIYPGLFGKVRVPQMLADLRPILRDWRPELLIHDSGEMAGAIAAEVAGIPHVEHSFGIVRPAELREAATDVVAPFAAELGVANPGVGGLNGELYLDVCPPEIQSPEIADVARVQPLRPVGFYDAPGAVLPTWLADRQDRPLVYVTMGTEFNKEPRIFRSILDGLAGEPLDVVVTVGLSGDPDALRPFSANVRVERFIPQSALLPHVAAFVSHGGSGATIGGIVAGVPMLAIPQGADQFFNSARIAETGVGMRLLPDELSPVAVRDAVSALIEDPRYRERAMAHQASLETMPMPSEVVPMLRALG